MGATVSIYDLNGVKIVEELDVTYETGSFILTVPWGVGSWDDAIPDEFKIVATGGKLGNETFTGTITRMVNNYSEERKGWAFYDLNAITTLMTAYMVAHPEVDYAEAVETVEEFLLVPSDFELAEVIEHSEYYYDIFYHEGFMDQASNAGGFDVFIDELVGEIDSGVGHPFYRQWGLGWTLDEKWESTKAGAELGVKIASTVHDTLLRSVKKFLGPSPMIWETATDVVGFIMTLCGYEDPMTARLREMSEKLDSILAVVNEIKAEINDMKNMLSEIQRALVSVENHLKQYIVGVAAQTPIAKIEATYTMLSDISKCEYVSEAMLTTLRNDILSTTQGVRFAMTLLHKLIMGEEGYGDGLLTLFSTSTVDEIQWQLPGYVGDVWWERIVWYFQALENYFLKLYTVQIQGLNLIMEAHLYRNETELAVNYLDQFQTKMEAQVEMYLTCAEYFVFNAHPTPIDEFPNMGPIIDRLIQIEAEPASIYYPNYNYNFSKAQKHIAQLLPRADWIADQILNGTGVFTARVLYDWGSAHSLVEGGRQPQPSYIGPGLEFVSTETGYKFGGYGEICKSTVATYNRLLAGTGTWNPPYGTIYYQRYKFKNIPAGRYKLSQPDPSVYTFTPGLSDGIKWQGLISEYEGYCPSLCLWQTAWGVMLSKGEILVVQHWEANPPYDEFLYEDFIEVVEDADGHPYGYWGGFWHQGKGE